MSEKKFEDILRHRFDGVDSQPSPELKKKIFARQKTIKNRKMLGYLSLAASISIIIISLVFLFTKKEKHPEMQATEHESETKDSVQLAPDNPVADNDMNLEGENDQENIQIKAINWVTVSTGENIRQVSLPDGSKITLNNNSQIKYREDFMAHRDIQLQGEAFFEVVKGANEFTVMSRQLKVTVLGTSFDVLDRGDQKAAVYTLSGKVKVNHAEAEVTLLADQYCRINGKELQKAQGFDQNIIAWKTAVLAFQQQPISEVLVAVEQYYQVKFEMQKDLDCLVTVTLVEKNLDQALDMLVRITGLQIEKSDQHYTVSGNCR